MAKTEKAKSVKGSASGGKSLGGAPAKKKGRRLKRSIRRTLGTLFLISALLVAAIPADNLRASDGNDIMPYAASSAPSHKPEADIPKLESTDVVYVNKDTTIKFVYVPDDRNSSTPTYNTIIVDYQLLGNLAGNTLEIPNEMSAYRQYKSSGGQTGNYAAVGRNGNFLFYRETRMGKYNIVNGDNAQTAIDAAEDLSRGDSAVKVLSRDRLVDVFKTDTNGQPTAVLDYQYWEVTEEFGPYIVCYADYEEDWKDIDESRLYYDTAHTNGNDIASDLTAASTCMEQVKQQKEYWRIKDVMVNYISDQKFNADDDKWERITDPNDGVFAGEGAVRTLSFGEDFKGVGDYAFYDCTGLGSISFSNGLSVLGQGAFQNCVNMTSVSLETFGQLKTLGAYAFKDCSALTSFAMPVGVTSIGDCAFEGCTSLANVYLCGEVVIGSAGSEGGLNTVLNQLGQEVFKDCRALKSITFPALCRTPVYISTFKGCSSLEFICARNENMDILEDTGYYTYKEFKEMLSKDNELDAGAIVGSFYLAGLQSSGSFVSKLHETAKKNCFAYRYIYDSNGNYEPQNYYELTMEDTESTDGGKNTFVVTPTEAGGQLYRYSYENTVKSLTIPSKIGDISIATLNDKVFANYCNLETVVIPSTVKAIGAEAFKGCHNLTNVIFTGFDVNKDVPDNVTIGANAFQTQGYTGGSTHKCKGTVVTTAGGKPEKELCFTGPVSPYFGPYTYAMSKGGVYSSTDQNQTASYITYYSGWPTNLEIRYDPDTNMSVLEDFPALSELTNVKYVASKYKYLDMPGAEKEGGETAYQAAIKNAYTNYKFGKELTGDQPKLIDAALNLVIPDGVDAVREGLIKEKENLDLNQGPLVDGNTTTPEKTVTAYSLQKIKRGEEVASVSGNGDVEIKDGTGTFAGCRYLSKISLLQGREGVSTVIDDYAFQDCTGLTAVEIADNISQIGECPFYRCNELTDVNFQNSPYYSFSKGIIYGLENGKSIVQCLGSRDDYISGGEFVGVTSLRPAAFKGSRAKEINLSKTTVKTLPERVFADTREVNKITMPSTVTTIEADAFNGSTVEFIVASSSLSACDPRAMEGLVDKTGGDRNHEEVTWCCVEGDDLFVNRYGVLQHFNITHEDMDTYYTVIFRDWDAELGRNVQVDTYEDVLAGSYVKPPKPRGRDDEGMMFNFWEADDGVNTYDYVEDFQISSNLTITAQYKKASEDYNKIEVTFLDYDGVTVLKTDWVSPGGDAVPPSDPSREGYRFTGWMPAITNITKPVTTIAQYALIKEGECLVRYIIDDEVYYTTTVMAGSTAPPIQLPTIEGKTFSRWLPALGTVFGDTDYYAIYVDSSSTDPNNPDDPNNPNNPNDPNNPNNPNDPNNPNNPDNPGNSGDDNKPTSKLYTLTVRNGSGSGSYAEDSHPIIIANDPAEGQEFSSWTIDPSDTEIASRAVAATVITMPDKDVTVTANYKAKTSTTSGSGTTGSNNSSKTPGTTSTVKKGGTTVVINKNGLSNTGVVSATVNGSSDNFTVKISESSTAAEAILRALQAEYGSDLSRIVYFPMDISLYDSTGQTKITDTTGLSISITLPLPDNLIAYAGNNKVAGVVNDKLDKLSPKFTTISGVSCITFTATHFSPYVIYVDTGNLNASAMADNTPKTGDGIHPKWFLSMGLGCASIVMFMKKDKRKPKKKLAKI